MKQDDHSELIQKYFHQKLSPEEQQLFNQLQNDAAFQQELKEFTEQPSKEELICIFIKVIGEAFHPRENCFQLLKYSFVDGKNYKEILETDEGKEYGSVEALRNRISNCLKRVKGRLRQELNDNWR